MDEMNADVAVIGAGAAGSAIAGEVLRAGLSVVLVEAGPHTTPGRFGRHLRNDGPGDDGLQAFGQVMRTNLSHHGRSTGDHGDIEGFRVSHGPGGGMALWFNNCPEPEASERNRAVPAEQWLHLLERARTALSVGVQPSVRGERLERRIAGLLPAGPADRGVQPMPTAAVGTGADRRFVGADDLLLGESADLPAHASVLSGHVARRVVLAFGRVIGIEVHPAGGGVARMVRAEKYVVCAGAVGTPQLLQASGLANEALGSYLMDHPMLMTRVALSSEVFTGAPADDAPFSVWIPVRGDRTWHTQLSRTPYLPSLPDVPDAETGDLISFGSTSPDPANRLHFDPTRVDAFGLPAYRGTLRLDDGARQRRDAMILDHVRLFEALTRRGRPWTPTMPIGGTSLHLSGTHRMGRRDDGTSVADVNSQVWGVDNLYVGGNGLLSEPNACNPTLQTVALALRSADHIVGRSPGSGSRTHAGVGVSASGPRERRSRPQAHAAIRAAFHAS
ncbi:GMC family oxidoreductase N-terminal domain-containing protein [uncultured Arthrobacter sp.]|uniref:GMC family oxidoreductase N-terminal domain-containing protein n=1 Tax=uncultured Arthrobacter sp. TaxID=114050 RepID=UPI0025FFF25A|nr:GMC oxidoreductase [uncultured Arthrobacter sp.]